MLDVENLRNLLTDIISIAIERELAHGMVEHSMKQVLKSEAKFQIIFDRLPWVSNYTTKTGICWILIKLINFRSNTRTGNRSQCIRKPQYSGMGKRETKKGRRSFPAGL